MNVLKNFYLSEKLPAQMCTREDILAHLFTVTSVWKTGETGDIFSNVTVLKHVLFSLRNMQHQESKMAAILVGFGFVFSMARKPNHPLENFTTSLPHTIRSHYLLSITTPDHEHPSLGNLINLIRWGSEQQTSEQWKHLKHSFLLFK